MHQASLRSRPPYRYQVLLSVTALLTVLSTALVGSEAEVSLQVGRWSYSTLSFAGAAGDRLVAAGIQSDGTIVLAGSISAGPLVANRRELRPGNASLIRLSEDGRRVLSSTAVGGDIRSLAIDDTDHLVVALGSDGVLARLDPQAQRILWTHETGGVCGRVAVAQDGTVAALRFSNDSVSTPRAGGITLLKPSGELITTFSGHRHTLDIAICSESQMVVLVGWRQARSAHPDGPSRLPVQIAYTRGVGFDGETKYTNYDWPTDTSDPAFLNRPTNNMADTRGYRINRGRDGKIYAGFEVAGGNHIFRYHPRLENSQWVSAGDRRSRGDNYFEWHNSRSEHKLFVGRYDPATGEYLRGQQFAGRLDGGRGRTNAVRMNQGHIAADESGRTLALGSAAFGLPVMSVPPGTTTVPGGLYALLLSPQMNSREIMTRISPRGQALGGDIRRVNQQSRIVLVGHLGADTDRDIMFAPHQAVQEEGEHDAAWFVVMTEGNSSP